MKFTFQLLPKPGRGRAELAASAFSGIASTRCALVKLVASAVLAGCASPSPPPVLLSLPSAFAAASAADSAAVPPASGASAPLLAVRRIGIPEYLVARRVRYRADASTLAEWPNTFWAERIEVGVSREFSSALRRQLPDWELCDANCGDSSPNLALQIDIAQLDFLRAGPRLQAHARISVVSTGSSPASLQARELTYDLPAAADTAQAEAEAIAELMRRLAQASAPLVRVARP